MQDEVRQKREEKTYHLDYIRKLECIISEQRNFLGLEEHFVAEIAIGDCPPDDRYDQQALKELTKMEEECTIPEP